MLAGADVCSIVFLRHLSFPQFLNHSLMGWLIVGFMNMGIRVGGICALREFTLSAVGLLAAHRRLAELNLVKSL
jgi:hypothetical protein